MPRIFIGVDRPRWANLASDFAPSVAVGVVYKTNIEEKLEDKLSDAEYEMFNNKFEVKNAPGYQERLKKGIS